MIRPKKPLPLTKTNAPLDGSENYRAAPPALIFVVEDEPLVRRVIVGRLTRGGYQTLHAETGADALRALHELEFSPSLLITDLVLPDINGRELVTAARQRWPGLRALFMSGYPEGHLIPRGLLQDDDPFIEKSALHTDLLGKISEILTLF